MLPIRPLLVAVLLCDAGCAGAAKETPGSSSDAGLSDVGEPSDSGFASSEGDAHDASSTVPHDAGARDGSVRDGAIEDGSFHEATHTMPTIPANGGPVLAHPTLVTITFDDDSNRAFAEALGGYLVQSPWLTAVGPEYGIGLGTHVPVELPQTAPATIDDPGIQELVASLLLAGTLPAPTGGAVIPTPAGSPFDAGADDSGEDDGGDAGTEPATLIPAVYMIYFPVTTSVTFEGTALCDFSGGGYHSQLTGSVGGQTFAYAVIAPCPQAPQAQLETAVSHEFIEASTDPAYYTAPAYAITDPDSVWGQFGGEVGDLCSFVEPQWSEGGYTALQRVYSNDAAKAGGDPCLPFNGTYFATDVEPQTFVAVPAGESTTFSVAGWSTTPVATWGLGAAPYLSQPMTFMPTASLSTSTMANGEKATLTVSVPVGAASRSYATLLVGSEESQTNYGYSLVGVYVP